MPTFATFSPRLPNNAPATVLPVFEPARVGPLGVWSPSYNLVTDHTPSVPTLGGPNTGSTAAVALLGYPGEIVAKVGTILPNTLPTPFGDVSHDGGKTDDLSVLHALYTNLRKCI